MSSDEKQRDLALDCAREDAARLARAYNFYANDVELSERGL